MDWRPAAIAASNAAFRASFTHHTATACGMGRSARRSRSRYMAIWADRLASPTAPFSKRTRRSLRRMSDLSAWPEKPQFQCAARVGLDAAPFCASLPAVREHVDPGVGPHAGAGEEKPEAVDPCVRLFACGPLARTAGRGTMRKLGRVDQRSELSSLSTRW
jgi:hypothetical protein